MALPVSDVRRPVPHNLVIEVTNTQSRQLSANAGPFMTRRAHGTPGFIVDDPIKYVPIDTYLDQSIGQTQYRLSAAGLSGIAGLSLSGFW